MHAELGVEAYSPKFPIFYGEGRGAKESWQVPRAPTPKPQVRTMRDISIRIGDDLADTLDTVASKMQRIPRYAELVGEFSTGKLSVKTYRSYIVSLLLQAGINKIAEEVDKELDEVNHDEAKAKAKALWRAFEEAYGRPPKSIAELRRLIR